MTRSDEHLSSVCSELICAEEYNSALRRIDVGDRRNQGVVRSDDDDIANDTEQVSFMILLYPSRPEDGTEGYRASRTNNRYEAERRAGQNGTGVRSRSW